MDWLSTAYKAALQSTELRREMLKFQARKLKLMTDIADHCLGKDPAISFNEITENSSDLAANWLKHLGEQMLSPRELIEAGHKVYRRALPLVLEGLSPRENSITTPSLS
jgi:hypothetical protein